MISSTIHQCQDENLIPLEALCYEAKVQYATLPLLQTQLSNGESIIAQGIPDGKLALATLEGGTRVAKEHLTAEIAGEFRRQEA